MKKPSLYPIFFGLTVIFTAQTSFAAGPRCCTDPCGSSIPFGCCAENVRPQCSPLPQPQSTATPDPTPAHGPSGGNTGFGDYSIIQENGVYKAVRN